MRSTRSARGSRSPPTRWPSCLPPRARSGLPVKLHADQLSDTGGAALAARFGALSADHVEHTGEAGARAMARCRDRGRAAARRLLFAAGDPAPTRGHVSRGRRADGGGDRRQSRHLAAAGATAGAEHGLRSVRTDTGGGAGRNDPGGRPGLGPDGPRRHPCRRCAPTSQYGASSGRPSSVTGWACSRSSC